MNWLCKCSYVIIYLSKRLGLCFCKKLIFNFLVGSCGYESSVRYWSIDLMWWQRHATIEWLHSAKINWAISYVGNPRFLKRSYRWRVMVTITCIFNYIKHIFSSYIIYSNDLTCHAIIKFMDSQSIT